jgi:hypothetical protein
VVSTDDALWDMYVEAIIECEIDGRPHHLRGPDAEPLPADAPIFVLTAYNPGGVERGEAENEADERALEGELAAGSATFWPALGHSRDGSWSEPGVALDGFDRAAACALGDRWGQLAVYELTDEQVHVVRCANTEIVRSGARRK